MLNKKPSEADLKKIASDMIADHAVIALHSAGLEAGKVKLRDYCIRWNNKAGFKLTVEGLGVVSVSAPSAAKEASQVPVAEQFGFNVDKFKELPKKLKEQLIATGVVQYTPATMKDVPAKPEGTPAITVTVVTNGG